MMSDEFDPQYQVHDRVHKDHDHRSEIEPHDEQSASQCEPTQQEFNGNFLNYACTEKENLKLNFHDTNN
jgi:hypothetical protein